MIKLSDADNLAKKANELGFYYEKNTAVVLSVQ